MSRPRNEPSILAQQPAPGPTAQQVERKPPKVIPIKIAPLAELNAYRVSLHSNPTETVLARNEYDAIGLYQSFFGIRGTKHTIEALDLEATGDKVTYPEDEKFKDRPVGPILENLALRSGKTGSVAMRLAVDENRRAVLPG